MTEDAGKLSDDQLKQVGTWLKSHEMPPPPCPICGKTDWIIAPHFVQPLTLGPNNTIQLGGLGYPHLMVMSRKCGYTMFFNAVVVGLLPAATSETADK